jgi:septum formation protein
LYDAVPGAIVLASGSPRRREILETLRIPLSVRPVTVDESMLPGEAPGPYLERVVAAKLASASAVCAPAEARLVADTIVTLGASVLGKPVDDAEARATLSRLSGRTHEVRTRFALQMDDRVHAETVTTHVRFIPLSTRQIDRYVATGEGRDKAGAYAVQGIGAFLVAGIEGSYTNVVGLPACEVVQALVRLGVISSFPLAERRAGVA